MKTPSGVSRRVEQCVEQPPRRDYEGALVNLFPAIDKTAKRRRPNEGVGKRIRAFLQEEEVLITVVATGSVFKGCQSDGMSFHDALYKFGRTSIAHEGELDPRFPLTAQQPQTLMPCTTIDVRTQYTEEQERAIIDAVHAALVEAFKIPPHDKNVRLNVHLPHRFACPPAAEHPHAYTHVTIYAFAGRSLDAKRALYRAVVDNLASLGIPPDHVMVLLRESPAENWGIRGGQAACDVALGFKVDV